MKHRFIRVGAELTDDTVVVVRGGPLDEVLLREAATAAHEIYDTYAVSVFAAHGVSVDELAQEPPLVRFEILTLMTVGTIRRAGLRLVPSGRNPLHHSIDFDDLDDGISRLVGCERRVYVNPYHDR